MDKFKIKHPTNADFEEKLAKYAKLADDVWRQARISEVMTAAVLSNSTSHSVPGKHPTHDCILLRHGSMQASYTCMHFVSFVN